MFLVFRVVVRGLSLNKAILSSVASSSISMILSLDSITGVAIYFGPKIYNILTEDSPEKRKSGLAAATTVLVTERHNGGDVSGVARLRKLGISVVVSRNDSVSSSISKNIHEEDIKAGEAKKEEGETKSFIEKFPVPPMKETELLHGNLLNASPETHFHQQFEKEGVEGMNEELTRIKIIEKQDNHDSCVQENSETNDLLESNSQGRPIQFDNKKKLVCGIDEERKLLLEEEVHDDPLPIVMTGEETREDTRSLIEEVQDAEESNDTKADAEAG